jgi:hypothetical protein
MRDVMAAPYKGEIEKSTFPAIELKVLLFFSRQPSLRIRILTPDGGWSCDFGAMVWALLA